MPNCTCYCNDSKKTKGSQAVIAVTGTIGHGERPWCIVRYAECVFRVVTAVTECLGLVDVRAAWLTERISSKNDAKMVPRQAPDLSLCARRPVRPSGIDF